MPLLKNAQIVLNSALRPLGVQVVRGHSTDPAVRSYLPARRTRAAAHRAGLSVVDYLDGRTAAAGTTAATVATIVRIAGLTGPLDAVCEIGPGSGRYAEEVIEQLRPRRYEMYETARDWLPHLRSLPGAVLRPADGHSLASTTSGSIDLVHAQKVFVYLPFYAVVGYLLEMVRVLTPGGVAAFDVLTEECLSDQLVRSWVAEGSVYAPTPRKWLVEFLGRQGLQLCGAEQFPLTGGSTEMLVFRSAAG